MNQILFIITSSLHLLVYLFSQALKDDKTNVLFHTNNVHKTMFLEESASPIKSILFKSILHLC